MMKILLLGLVAMAAIFGEAQAVEFGTVEISGKRVTTCRVNVRSEHIQLFERSDSGRPFNRFDTLASWLQSHGMKLLFAMNGGMYHGDYSPVGLFVAGGESVVPVNTDNGEGNFFLKPNGIFAVSASGAHVVESSEYSTLRERIILATQSGPMLVHDGRIHPAFHADSPSRLFRNGVGVPSPDVAIFAISEEPVNFYEFATLFRDKLRCPNALFLDGSISSLYSTELKRDDFHMNLGPIIAVTE